MEKIQKFTDAQSKQIEKVTEPHYDNLIKARSMLKLLREHSFRADQTRTELENIEIAHMVEVAINMITPTQDFLAEVSCGAWYLLDKRAEAI